MNRLVIFLLCCWMILAARAVDYRGSEFIACTSFDRFTAGSEHGEASLTSPEFESHIDFDELILSWNFRGVNSDRITIEARVIYPDHSTKWYSLGNWSRGVAGRESTRKQKDADGDVATDTLRLKRNARRFQMRVRKSGSADFSALALLAANLHDTSAVPVPLLPNRAAWGKTLKVPERSQANYPEGISSWCSPTSTSMLLAFWGDELHRPDLVHDVPEVAAGVNDPNWPGTGNWPFNMAYAGAHPGMRAYVTRLTDVSELEDWIDAGIPVAISVAYPLLKGQHGFGNGHLVVCIGFDANGNIVVNDPGRRAVHQTYKRDNLIRAWKYSENTVYLVYPESASAPPDRFHHWLSRKGAGLE